MAFIFDTEGNDAKKKKKRKQREKLNEERKFLLKER